MSKRKLNAYENILLNNEPALQKKKEKLIIEDQGKEFLEIVEKAGYMIGRKNDPNELNVDQSLFVRDLNKYLTTENDIALFLDGLEKLIEDELRFKYCLLPTVTSASCKTARNACQDSLIHLLLTIEPLQEKLSKILLDKLAEFSFSDTADLFDPTDGKSLACMILSQFRWLSKLVNGTYLTEQLLELVKAVPIEVQRDIILLVPEIVPECDHSKVAKCLSEIILQNHELNVPILDTLSSLIVDPATVSSVRQQVLKTLTTANIEDLPGIVRFVLNNLTPDETADTITELRTKLDFAPSFDPLMYSTPAESNASQDDKNVGCLVMTQVKLALKFQKPLCKHWIKLLNQIETPESFQSFDILVLLVLHSLVMFQKKVEQLFKNKIKSGEITENLLSIIFRSHHGVLRGYIQQLLSLSEILLRSIDSVVSDFGHSMYLKSFVWFDTFTKQEIVGNLVTHVGNGSFNEMNAALATLLDLVKRYAPKMITFNLFIKNLLEYIDDLTLPQIRQVYQMLSILSYQGGRDGAILEDDMHMIIRKQLTNGNIRYRKMGVIGALMAANTACTKVKKETDSPELMARSQLAERKEGAIAQLDLIKTSISSSSEALGLFYDEFCRKMANGKVDPFILEWIDAHLLADFEDQYVISIGPDTSTKLPAGAYLKFGLDDDIDDPIALNLYNVMKKNIREKTQGKDQDRDSDIDENILAGSQNTRNQSSILPLLLKFSRSAANGAGSSKPLQANALILSPTFRLLCFRNQSKDGTLSNIDALLGCAVVLPELKPSCFNSLPMAEKRFILDVLFHIINWFRENINAFTINIDDDFKLNIILRLQLLIELQVFLCKYIQVVPNYIPPLANFDCETSDCPPLKFSSTKPASKKGKKGRKTAKPPSSQCTQARATQKSQSISPTAKDDSIEDDPHLNTDQMLLSVMNSLRPYLRELDVNVFTLFEFAVTFRKPCDVFSGEKERETLLHPKELKFLLDDLLSKLNHRFTSSFRSRLKLAHQQSGYSNLNLHPIQKVASFCVKLIPSLCHILDKCGCYFRNLIAETDGIMDSLLVISEDSQLISTCMKLIFKVLQIIISWKEFESGENVMLLKQAIRAFTVRDEALPEHTALQDLISHAVEYLVKFEDAIVSLTGAAAHVKLLESIVSYSKERPLKNKVSTVAEDFLTRQWLDLDKKRSKPAQTNPSIQVLLEVSLKHSESVLQSIKKLLVEAIPNLTDENADNSLRTLNKSSISLHYKIMMSNLVDAMKIYYAKKKVRPGDEEFAKWNLSVKLFQELVNLIKLFDGRSIIQVSLLYGRQFVDIFLKHGMPLLDLMFNSDPQRVILLLKELQKGTRYMQHVCGHSKVLKDVTLTREVPFLKKTLESFVYRVKVMLAVNKCEEAFWLGNLKNRDLKGTEILSQTVENSDDDDDPKSTDSEPESVKAASEHSDIGSDVEI